MPSLHLPPRLALPQPDQHPRDEWPRQPWRSQPLPHQRAVGARLVAGENQLLIGELLVGFRLDLGQGGAEIFDGAGETEFFFRVSAIRGRIGWAPVFGRPLNYTRVTELCNRRSWISG